MIPETELTKGWYRGQGRNSDIAYWTGSTFLTIGKKFGKYGIKDEGYCLEKGFSCFKPDERIADTKIEPLCLSDFQTS